MITAASATHRTQVWIGALAPRARLYTNSANSQFSLLASPLLHAAQMSPPFPHQTRGAPGQAECHRDTDHKPRNKQRM